MEKADLRSYRASLPGLSKKNIWLCQLNDEPRAYKRDIGFSERHLDALGESIAAPGVGDLSWLAEPMKLQVQIPTGQE